MFRPRYLEIKEALRERIERGDLKPGDRVPSENELTSMFSVSRMTARRALRELADAGLLVRAPGLGTFVADLKSAGSVMQVRDIAEEIRLRGHRHSSRLLEHGVVEVEGEPAIQLGLAAGERAFYTALVHVEDDRPVQYERRWVKPRSAPDYLAQDFTETTPSAWLSSFAPLTEAEQTVEAVLPEPEVARALGIAKTAPCLQLRRRTFVGSTIMSFALLVHPGDRYRLVSHVDNRRR